MSMYKKGDFLKIRSIDSVSREEFTEYNSIVGIISDMKSTFGTTIQIFSDSWTTGRTYNDGEVVNYFRDSIGFVWPDRLVEGTIGFWRLD